MYSAKLIRLIEKDEEELVNRSIKDIRENEFTIHYHKFPEDKLRERALDVFKHLTDWLKDGDIRDHMEHIYTRLGGQRYHEGFRISEVVQAFIAVRRTLGVFVQEQEMFDSVDLYQALELVQSVNRFFDKVIHFSIRGYENEAGLLPPRHKR